MDTDTILHLAQGGFALFCGLFFVAFAKTKQRGLLLAAVVYGLGAAVSFLTQSWMPLVGALIASWFLRFLGFDHAPDRKS